MRRVHLRLSLLAILSTCLFAVGVRAQGPRADAPRENLVAVTIDDLPLSGPHIEPARLRAMTERILSGLRRHKIPAVGFVNESLLYVPGETDERIALLKAWLDAGAELGNHTFSHMGFRGAQLAAYEDDFVRGDAVTKMLMRQSGQKPRYFRHPFLQMGDTLEAEKSFEGFIAERGYRIAPVSVDTMDWMFLAAYSDALKRGDEAARRRVSEDYLKFAARKFDTCLKSADALFGRPVKHILLLHANELNSDNFDALVKVIEDRGFRFITLEEALADPAYLYPDKYVATSDWFGLWSFSKGVKLDSLSPPEYIRKAYADEQK